MKKMTRLFLAGGFLLYQVNPAAAERITLPKDTPVIVKLLETVSSGTHKKGDRITLAVATDVIVQGKTVIAARTPVTGTVESAAKRFIAGIGGQLEISVNEVQAVDGTRVPLRFKKETHNGSTLMSAILATCCCICAWLIPGKDVSIEKGTLFDAVTLSPVEINLPGAK